MVRKIGRNDPSYIKSAVDTLLTRRRALVPFPLTHVREIEEVIYPSKALTVIRWVSDNYPNLIKSTNSIDVRIPEKTNVMLKIRTQTRVLSGWSTQLIRPNSRPGRLIRGWVSKIEPIERENAKILRVIQHLSAVATTHDKLYQYMPELYDVFRHVNSNSYDRLSEIAREMQKKRTSRSSGIEADVPIELRRRIHEVFAESMLIPRQAALVVSPEFTGTYLAVTP